VAPLRADDVVGPILVESAGDCARAKEILSDQLDCAEGWLEAHGGTLITIFDEWLGAVAWSKEHHAAVARI